MGESESNYDAHWQFSADTTSVLFRVQTLKLNTLAINLTFMRLSRGIEGSDGCNTESVGPSRERERERGERERVKIVYMHLYPSFRGEGCPVAMVTRWLIGRTTDAGRRFAEGRKILRRIPCSLIYYSARQAWATMIRAMTLAMSYNLEENYITTRGEAAGALFAFFLATVAFITGREDISPECMSTKICDLFYILLWCLYVY